MKVKLKPVNDFIILFIMSNENAFFTNFFYKLLSIIVCAILLNNNLRLTIRQLKGYCFKLTCIWTKVNLFYWLNINIYDVNEIMLLFYANTCITVIA